MKPFVGHWKTLQGLPIPLPPVTLMSGPEGVGKRRLAYMLALKTDARGYDLQKLGPLTVEGAHELLRHHSSMPMESPVRTSVLDLTNASPKALTVILKTLEEPPEFSRIIMHTDRDVPLTIKSRAFNLRFGVLTEAEVLKVLQQEGVNASETAARVSGGRVSVAMDYAANHEARGRVEAILKALHSRGPIKLQNDLYTALRVEPGQDGDAMREVVARLLRISIHASLSDPKHILSFVPEQARIEALKALRSPARAAFRVRAAIWTMAAAV